MVIPNIFHSGHVYLDRLEDKIKCLNQLLAKGRINKMGSTNISTTWFVFFMKSLKLIGGERVNKCIPPSYKSTGCSEEKICSFLVTTKTLL